MTKKIIAPRKAPAKQVVKTFSHYVPQDTPDVHEKEITKVRFDPERGVFLIELPSHISSVVRGINDLSGNFDPQAHGFYISHDDQFVTSAFLEGCMRGYKDTLMHYEAFLKANNKTKVIRFTMQANRKWETDGDNDRGNGSPIRAEISFAGSPALYLTYEVLYRSGKHLYEVDGKGRMEYRSSRDRKDSNVIAWTQEREDFFESMRARLISLIDAFTMFEKTLAIDPDRAIAGMGGVPQLAPPTRQRVRHAPTTEPVTNE